MMQVFADMDKSRHMLTSQCNIPIRKSSAVNSFPKMKLPHSMLPSPLDCHLEKSQLTAKKFELENAIQIDNIHIFQSEERSSKF